MTGPRRLREIPLGDTAPIPNDGVSNRVDRHAVFARGGMSEVWSGSQRSLSRSVAVKTVRRDAISIDDPEATTELERSIKREAFVASLLEHPAIVPVYDYIENADGGEPQLVMRMVRGLTWSEDLRQTLPDLDVSAYLARHLGILVDVAQAIAFAHSKGIIHRDLKPSQVMLGEFGEVQLLDWGMAARIIDDTQHPSLQLLAKAEDTGMLEGTPAYMAPEQAKKSQHQVGTHTDIYQLGGILYQILCGQPPHAATSQAKALEHAAAGLVDPPTKVLGERRFVPVELESLAMKSLAVDPRERPASARLFAASVSDYLAGNNRRRRAQSLMDEARALLNDHGAGYTPQSKALALIEEARGLWPENSEIDLSVERTVERMARTALVEGDLKLAEAMASRLGNLGVRAAIEKDVSAEHAARRRREVQRRIATVTAIVFAVITALVGGGWLVYSAEVRRRESEAAFVQRAAEARGALDSKIAHHLETIRTLASLFTISGEVSRRDFAVFVTPIVERHTGLYALEWSPIISHAERAAYEAALAAENLGNTRIIEPGDAGLVPAPDRDAYFPVHYAEPMSINQPILGLDAGFSPERRMAFDLARDRALETASSRIRLVEETGDEYGVLVAVPSYRDGVPLNTPEDRRAAFRGFAVAIWRMGDFLRSALQGQVDSGSTFLLWDASAKEGEELLGSYRPSAAAPRETEREGTRRRRETLVFAGRTWVLEMVEHADR